MSKGFLVKSILPKSILLLSPLFTGLLNDSCCFAFALVILFGILYKITKNKHIILPKGKKFFFILLYALSFFVIEIWAVDKGNNIFGVMRFLIIPLFIILIQQYIFSEKDKYELIRVIPNSAILSEIISLIFVLLKKQDILIDGRLTGTFFYPNSYAMFLLIGLAVIMLNTKKNKLDYIKLFLLLLGIVLTNSRIVILLTIAFFACYFVFKLIKKQNYNSKELIITSTIVLLILIIYISTGLAHRFDIASLGNSGELNLRFVYYEDALNMIAKNPLGLGFDGYYYKQLETQTAQYSAKAVHCFWLQNFLDGGIVLGLLIIGFFVAFFFDKKIRIEYKIIIGLLLIHSTFDINMSYIYFWILIALLCEFKPKRYELINKAKILVYTCLIALVVAYIPFSVSSIMYETSNYKMAYKTIPFHTNALLNDLYNAKNEKEQVELSNKIYMLNKNIKTIYPILSYQKLKNEEFLEALPYEKRRLDLDYLSQKAYDNYFALLEEGVVYYNSLNDYDNLRIFIDELELLEKRINETNSTSNKAYVTEIQITDKMQKTFDAVKELKY